MSLDPQTQALLEAMKQAGFPQPNTQPIELTRAAVQAMVGDLSGPRAAVASVRDRTIPGPGGPIPVRIYHPRVEAGKTAPLLVFLHGGGWVLGTLDSYDGLCCELTRQAGCVTVSVDYRLAPEHPFPAALDDCQAALEWAAGEAQSLGADPRRIAVAGDSAGGNLTAACALRALRQKDPPLAQLILFYPVTDLGGPGLPSRQRNAEGYFLTESITQWFIDQYVPNAADRLNPEVSVLRAPDLRGFPPTLVITAELDPLVDEGEAFAARLQEAGVTAKCSRYAGTIHGFVGFYPMLEAGRTAIQEAAACLRNIR